MDENECDFGGEGTRRSTKYKVILCLPLCHNQVVKIYWNPVPLTWTPESRVLRTHSSDLTSCYPLFTSTMPLIFILGDQLYVDYDLWSQTIVRHASLRLRSAVVTNYYSSIDQHSERGQTRKISGTKSNLKRGKPAPEWEGLYSRQTP